jgi:hypothetical protein
MRITARSKLYIFDENDVLIQAYARLVSGLVSKA